MRRCDSTYVLIGASVCVCLGLYVAVFGLDDLVSVPAVQDRPAAAVNRSQEGNRPKEDSQSVVPGVFWQLPDGRLEPVTRQEAGAVNQQLRQRAYEMNERARLWRYHNGRVYND